MNTKYKKKHKPTHKQLEGNLPHIFQGTEISSISIYRRRQWNHRSDAVGCVRACRSRLCCGGVHCDRGVVVHSTALLALTSGSRSPVHKRLCVQLRSSLCSPTVASRWSANSRKRDSSATTYMHNGHTMAIISTIEIEMASMAS